MAEESKFAHLRLALRERLRADFGKRKIPTPAAVTKNLENRPAHVAKVRGALAKLRETTIRAATEREEAGVPVFAAGAGFVMRIPEMADPAAIAHALGLELVAETEGGYLLVASEDLEFARLEEVLSKFEGEDSGGGAAAVIVDVFESPNDPHRIDRLLTDDVRALWPFDDGQEYVFDVSIQTAEGTRSFAIPRIKRRKEESEDAFRHRRDAARAEALAQADEGWTAKAEERFSRIDELVRFYGGALLTGIAAEQPLTLQSAIQFPDSFQVRARVKGGGWRDIIYNVPNIFELALPDDVQQPLPPSGIGRDEAPPDFVPPSEDAPRVCIIDSGIQEGHLWLESAIDTANSRCFLPGRDRDDVADEVPAGGHGTRVAGAVLYPYEVPRNGPVKPIAWLQNARVLGADNQLPTDLAPARSVEQVVEHYYDLDTKTRIFNHSIAATIASPVMRMTTWATKIDELSHNEDVLFIQPTGNIRSTNDRPNNPGIFEHAEAGRPYPNYLREPSSRVANPGQSLQALTVGSVCGDAWTDGNKRGIATLRNFPSSFSRSGLGIWESVKPEVVEVGGDFATNAGGGVPPTIEEATAIELIRATDDGGPAIARDKVGTSFAAPKIAHLAARLQTLLPASPTLLYRALIVHSSRWPDSLIDSGWTIDQALQSMGYGMPSLERATTSSPERATLITPNATVIRNQELHLYKVMIPPELRNRADDIMLRIDVTLSYSSEPRRTRTSRRGYLATWLDWRSSGLREPTDAFLKRVASGEDKPDREYKQLDWCLHYSTQHGDASETHRGNGTVQKDWASVLAHDLPDEFAIAVRAHKGWDHRENGGGAKYCLVVSVEAEDVTIPVYSAISAVNVEVETPVEQEAEIELSV
jgi:hypothetical protein